jgi:pimeloyl-ACP methyl ester carboxylesterase
MKAGGTAYEVRGEGEWLLLIAGIGASREAWQFLIDAFTARYRCIIFDNRGIGETDFSDGPYTTKQMADDAARLLRTLGVKRAHVMGISMGGAIAQELAINHPGLIDRLAIVCSWPACDRYLERCFVILKETALAEGEKGPGWSNAVQRVLSLIGFSQRTFANHPEIIDAGEAGTADAVKAGKEQPYPGFVAQADACLTHDARGRLGKIAAETLILAGDMDNFTPLPLSEALKEAIPRARMEIMAGCGHVMFLERTDEFNERILGFFEGAKAER